MAIRQGTSLCCADVMITGRWYKLVAHEVGYDVPYNYTVTYSVSDTNVAFLLFDSVYIKRSGSFTITATDMYGNTDQKTITAINEPTITRTQRTLTPSSWSDFQQKITAFGENSYITLTNGDYHFSIDETGYVLPKGTVIDLNGSNIFFSTSANLFNMLIICNDYCEIKNGSFVNECASDWQHSDMCRIIDVKSGYNCKLENLRFPLATGFNITVGTWSRWQELGTGTKWGNYNGDGVFNGRLDDSGNLVADTGSYSSEDFLNCTNVGDYTYFLGIRNNWIPQTARVYDIAFYDSNHNFIELRKNQQFYRKYKRPTNSVYWKTTIYQEEAPRVNLGGDDYCFYRMYGDGAIQGLTTGSCTNVQELVCNNLIADRNESGVISVVGVNTDCHFNRIRCDEIGSMNPWSFDIEDGWNASCNMVVSHSGFLNGRVYAHGAQGLTLLSCSMQWLVTNNNPYSVSAINCMIRSLYYYSIRNYLVMANSTINWVSEGTNSESEYTPYISNRNISGTWQSLNAQIAPYYFNYL